MMKQALIAGIVISVIGLSLLLVPAGKLWAFKEKLKTKDAGQPSQSYAILMRVLGAVFSMAGAALFVCGL